METVTSLRSEGYHEFLADTPEYVMSADHLHAMSVVVGNEDRALARPDCGRTRERRNLLSAVAGAVIDAIASGSGFRPELHDLTEAHAAAVFAVMEREIKAARTSAESGGRRPTDTAAHLWDVYDFVRDAIEQAKETGR